MAEADGILGACSPTSRGDGAPAALFISAKTASVHVSNILGKLGVASRTEAAASALRDGAARSA